jgi:RecA-family ATPase
MEVIMTNHNNTPSNLCSQPKDTKSVQLNLDLELKEDGINGIPPSAFNEEIQELEDSLNTSKAIYNAEELLSRNIESIPTLLEPILPKYGLIGIGGSSDTGKSSFLRQLAISICLDENDFLGFKINATHRKALYVITEDDDVAVSFLLNKANHKKRLSPDKYAGLSFLFDTHNLIEKIDNHLSIQKVDLIIIDAFTDLYGKSMNDTNQVRTFLNEYHLLSQKHKCLIIFLHHTGKRTDDLIPSKHNLLGSQGFEAKMRLVIELRIDHFDASKRHMCIVKGNYLPKEYKTESYVLEFDDNLQFSKTDERRLFEDLVSNSKSDLKERVKAMSEIGKTQKQIADELKISQSSVSRYLN